ncbi:hypothetical protein ACFWBV_29065 [Streptomyces sp. NPDC060030]|uniref:hypothetical protein n=1 Tax=Streptomyces sp. NPDC060030 TaxID=3347042 RepID=UPI003678B628
MGWAGFAVVLAVPVAAGLVSALALRHVVASPLAYARRAVPGPGRRAALGFLLAVALIATSALLLLFPVGPRTTPPVLLVLALVLLTGAGAIWTAGASAAFMGRTLTRRARRPAVLIAASRLEQDPWAAARTHAALLLVTVVAVGFVGVRAILLDTLTDSHRPVGLALVYVGYAMVVVTAPVPLSPLLVPVVVHAACLLAAATSLPLLRRAVNPAELRFT